MPLARPSWLELAAPVAIALSCYGAVSTGCPRPASAQPQQGSKGGVTGLIMRGSELFDDQQYEESVQTLSAALVRPGTTKTERIEIYRLLAYNFITLKRTEEADAAVRGILVLDEDFKLPTSESPRFRDFFSATRSRWESEGKPGRTEEGAVLAADKSITIKHASPAQAESGSSIKLSGTVDDPDGRVRGVQLQYRIGAKGKFVTVVGSFTMGQFRAQIPAAGVKPPLVEYYLQATDKSGLPVASRGDAATPLRVAVPEPRGAAVLTSPWFWLPVGVLVVGGAIATGLILSNTGTSQATVSVRVKE